MGIGKFKKKNNRNELSQENFDKALSNPMENEAAKSEPEIIVESWSPVCNIQAFVEKNDTCYYLYLWGNPSSDNPQIKTCWIANRKKSPKEMDLEAMRRATQRQL